LSGLPQKSFLIPRGCRVACDIGRPKNLSEPGARDSSRQGEVGSQFIENLLVAFYFKRFTSKEVFSYIPGNVKLYEPPGKAGGLSRINYIDIRH